MNRTSIGVIGNVSMNYTDFTVPMCDVCYRRGRSLQTIRFLSVAAMLTVPWIGLIVGALLAEAVSKPLGITVLLASLVLPFTLLPLWTGRIIGRRAAAMFDNELGGRLRMLVGGREFGLLCAPFFRHAPARNVEPVPIDTLMALPLNPQLGTPGKARRGGLAGLITAGVILAIAAFAVWATFFTPMKMLTRETEQKTAALRSAIDKAREHLPAVGAIEETKPDSSPALVIDRDNLMVLSLKTVEDAKHALDDRLPISDKHFRFDDHQTIYNWGPPKEEKPHNINRDLQAAREAWGDLNDTQYVVLVRFLEWRAPEETPPDRFAPAGGLAPGMTLFDAYLIDAQDGRLLAAKELDVDQGGHSIRYRPYENKIDVARKQLTELTLARIHQWLESECGATLGEVEGERQFTD